MAIVNQILKTKGNAVCSVSPDSMVIEALRLMAEKNIGAVIVTENNKLVGIFSERDYARKVVLKDKASDSTRISEIMTSNVFTVKTTTSIDDSMKLMTEKNFRHLPVVDDGKLQGVISLGDAVRFVIEEQKHTIKNLESYISGQ